MSRAVAAGIATELTRSGSQPGYLIQITLSAGTVLRMNTTDADFDYAGETFASADITVTDIGFDGTVGRAAALEFGDMTTAVWIGNLYREFDDAAISIWLFYVDAAGAAEPLFAGRCGKIERKTNYRGGATATIALDAEATTMFAPRQRMQDVIDQFWMLSAGSVIEVNGQRWIIDRPKTSNS